MKKRIFLSLLIFVMLITFSACGNVAGIATVDGENVEEEYFRYYFTELKNMMQNQQRNWLIPQLLTFVIHIIVKPMLFKQVEINFP